MAKEDGFIIRQATVVNEGTTKVVSLWIEPPYIKAISDADFSEEIQSLGLKVVDAKGYLLLPGVIDDQVHFREPGLTHKGNIASESRAAVAGGVTSYMDMPNVLPPTTTIELLQQKREIAQKHSYANYSFFLGATADNIEEIRNIDPHTIPGVKLFMGSSTGNMLVDDPDALDRIFAHSPVLIAVHCEDETVIRNNKAKYLSPITEGDLPISFHPLIRDEEACFVSSQKAVDCAVKHNARLHIFHLSTAKELSLLSDQPLAQKRITAEVCVHHLLFDNRDYERLGSRIKWNPSIKTQEDKTALWEGLAKGLIDVVATDHAPHLLSEKEGGALKAASGGPMIQHSLQVMLSLFPPTMVAEKMCHNPATLYRIEKRGFIREGYYADLVLIDPERFITVNSSQLLYQCGWSPLEGMTFSHTPVATFVNGWQVYDLEKGVKNTPSAAMELRFK